MLDDNSIKVEIPKLDAANASETQKIQDSMAKTRDSLSQKLGALENEVQRRVLDTFDQVNQCITDTTSHISEQITKPIDQLRGRVQAARQIVKSSPYKSLAASISFGFLLGALLGKRVRRPRVLILPGPVETIVVPSQVATRTVSPLRGIASTLAAQLTQQLISVGIDEINRRRDDARATKSALRHQS